MGRRRNTVRVTLKASEAWDRLRHLNWSQNDLAQASGLTPGYVSALFNGRRCASPQARSDIMLALGVDDFHSLFEVVRVDDE